MTLIGHILVWGTLGFIIYRYFSAKKKQDEIERHYFNEYQNAKNELIEVVEQTLGREEAECVLEKRIWVNMPKSLLFYIKRGPDDIKESVSSGNKYETWFYGASPYQYAGQTKYKYRFQVNIHNNIVTSWQDL